MKVDDTEVEKSFAEDLDKHSYTRVFAKLPSRFTVQTPVGTYNPDWAIVWQPKDLQERVKATLYLVRETKSTTDSLGLRTMENLKIDCAKEHFKAISEGIQERADYGVVTSVAELPDA